MNTNRAFIGYYQVLAGGIRAVFSRPAITVPRTPTNGPSNTLYTPAQLDTILVNILDTNELHPVQELSSRYSDSFFTALLGSFIQGVIDLQIRTAVKIGFIVPNAGIYKNIPCISLTVKSNNVKTVIDLPIIPMPPMAFLADDWTLASIAGGNLRVNMSRLPDHPNLLDIATDEVTLYIYANDSTTTSLAQFTLPSLALNADNDFVLAPETFTDGVTYYAELVAASADGTGPVSDRKSFVASM